MFIPWWGIVLGIIIVAGIASSGKANLVNKVAELEERIEELENEAENGSDDLDS